MKKRKNNLNLIIGLFLIIVIIIVGYLFINKNNKHIIVDDFKIYYKGQEVNSINLTFVDVEPDAHCYAEFSGPWKQIQQLCYDDYISNKSNYILTEKIFSRETVEKLINYEYGIDNYGICINYESCKFGFFETTNRNNDKWCHNNEHNEISYIPCIEWKIGYDYSIKILGVKQI